MAFPPEFLREVGERNRIEDVAASYVNLRRRGKNLVGLCPFHNEKTPSFCIYPENNSFFCFGCNKGGDVISFVMGVENLDFAEAVKFLAQRAGMALPEDGADLSMSRLRTRILEINRESGRFYYSVLSTPEGRAGAVSYTHLIMNILHQQYGIVESDLISAELEFVPAFKAVDIGFDRSMIGAYGHDDRVCAYPILEAIFQCKTPEYTCITVLADKEEIGSVGNTGLASEYLNYFVADLAAAEGLEARHVYTKSTCLSADVTAAFDPNYAYAYEAGNSTFLNRGVGLSKYTGSRGKGGSNDANAEFVGQVRKIFDEADVLWQIGELGKVDQGGGGTVALDISRMNADVIDVGVPVLSMHSPFEVVSKLDVYMAYKGFKAYFEAE